MTRFLILLAPLAMMTGFAGCDRIVIPRRIPEYDRQRYDDRYDRRYDYRRDEDRYYPRYRDDRYPREDRYYPRYRDDRYPRDDGFSQRRSNDFYADELLRLHNDERQRNSVPRLTANQDLQKAAREHAEWMAQNDRLTHRGENESDVQSRVGGNYRCVGENIAMGFYEPDEVMMRWMNSYGHKKNIIDRSYDKVGFGVAYARDGTMYWCVVFAC